MKRSKIKKIISLYKKIHPHFTSVNPELEEKIITKFNNFIDSHSNCFERSNTSGHITASALIFNEDRTKILLTLHKKLGRWLQLGGHADGCTDPEEVAIKEAHEESGLTHLSFLENPRLFFDNIVLPIDLDVHLIPTYKNTKAHFHYDLRYVMISKNKDKDIKISDESSDLQWIELKRTDQFVKEKSLLRLVQKATSLL